MRWDETRRPMFWVLPPFTAGHTLLHCLAQLGTLYRLVQGESRRDDMGCTIPWCGWGSRTRHGLLFPSVFSGFLVWLPHVSIFLQKWGCANHIVVYTPDNKGHEKRSHCWSLTLCTFATNDKQFNVTVNNSNWARLLLLALILCHMHELYKCIFDKRTPATLTAT